MVDIFRMSL